jgi:hypothetical protein
VEDTIWVGLRCVFQKVFPIRNGRFDGLLISIPARVGDRIFAVAVLRT